MDFSVTSVYINVYLCICIVSLPLHASLLQNLFGFFCFLLFGFAGCHCILFHFVFR